MGQTIDFRLQNWYLLLLRKNGQSSQCQTNRGWRMGGSPFYGMVPCYDTESLTVDHSG